MWVNHNALYEQCHCLCVVLKLCHGDIMMKWYVNISNYSININLSHIPNKKEYLLFHNLKLAYLIDFCINTTNRKWWFYHFKTKDNTLQLSWLKRLTLVQSSTWKILPSLFYNCNNLNKYFHTNQNFFKKNIIPTSYQNIHKLIQGILTQPFWQNTLIKTNKNHLMSNNILENKGIFFLKDIINNKGKFLNHNSINKKYKVKTIFLDLIHIQPCIPKIWKMTLITVLKYLRTTNW